MRKRNKSTAVRFIGVLFCVIFSVFFFVSNARADDDCENSENDSTIYIYCDTVWHKNDNLDFNKTVYVYPGATLTIEKGAQIKLVELYVASGRVVANGTQDEPISLTADSSNERSLIEFYKQDWDGVPELPPSFFRYVNIHGGGYEWDNSGGPYQSFLWPFVSSAYASMLGVGSVLYTGGKVHFENCTFYDNEYSDVQVKYNEYDSSTGTDNYLEIVNSNFEKNGDSYAVRSGVTCNDINGCYSKILLENDWYDGSSGPTEDSDTNDKGKKITGKYDLFSFKSDDLIADPAILIPGIMGSWPSALVSGLLVLDPVLHTYDNLAASFEKNGYIESENFFEFPYEWRDSNVQTAGLLEKKIQEVKNVTKVSKVDLVAHSMGGLVARYYIESPSYQNDVDQLITLGTPQHGAPEDYLEWEAGEGFFTREEKIAKLYFALEAYHSGFSNLQDYIQTRIRSVQELLPDYDYLKNSSDGKMRTYSNGYPQNTFLEFLNNQNELNKLKGVDFTSIVGDLDDAGATIKDFKVTDSTVSGSWADGMPENYGDASTDQGIEYGPGDGTVPLKSSEGIASDKQMELDSAHSDLPTNAQCDVIEELTGKSDCQSVNTSQITHILTFGVFSPVDIQIIAPDGKWIGKNINGLSEADKIDGAYYTGYDTANEFATIPNPEDGNYKVVAQGTGNGDYKIEVAKISEDENGQASEAKTAIEGVAAPGGLYENDVNTLTDLVAEDSGGSAAFGADSNSSSNTSEDDLGDSGGNHHENHKKDDKNKTSGEKDISGRGTFLAGANDVDINRKLWPNNNEKGGGYEKREKRVAGEAAGVSGKESVFSKIFLAGGVIFLVAAALTGGIYWRRRKRSA